ncbi:hypothetical protein PILCRDRAFT_533611 [Piloderma croceum F 1598]|uniref:Uncharacterized protein n=1 Tax=Piloderma croceum (strain F 1598) TaxID=765440 RepID=A0A0C3BSZ5_PILCF|nr:hypothetical protein PILCRDRAFT_533611 [Piloderma croceum F 1598]
MKPDRSYSAFFYGTLMHPDILKRVIGNDGAHLKICSAILLVRHPPRVFFMFCGLTSLGDRTIHATM